MERQPERHIKNPPKVCAWCSKLIDPGDYTPEEVPNVPPGAISHGMCLDCAKEWMKD